MVVEINSLHIDNHMHTRAFFRESPNEHNLYRCSADKNNNEHQHTVTGIHFAV